MREDCTIKAWAYALKLASGTTPQIIVVKDQAEKHAALSFLKGKAGADVLHIETQAENEAGHRHRRR